MGLGLLFGGLSKPERSSWAMDASLLHGNGVTGDPVYYPLSTKCFEVSHTEINWQGQLTFNCLCLQTLCCQVVRNMLRQTISLSNMKFPSKRLMSISDTQHRTVSALLYSKTAFLPMPLIAMEIKAVQSQGQKHGAKRSCTAQPLTHHAPTHV